MRITRRMLRRAHACNDQVERFGEEWPRGCVVDEKNVRRALELALDLRWFVNHLLKAEAMYEYEKSLASTHRTLTKQQERAMAAMYESLKPTRAIYEREIAPAVKVYWERVTEIAQQYEEDQSENALEAYQEASVAANRQLTDATTAAWMIYEEARVPVHAAYQAEVVKARDAFQETCIQAFLLACRIEDAS